MAGGGSGGEICSSTDHTATAPTVLSSRGRRRLSCGLTTKLPAGWLLPDACDDVSHYASDAWSTVGNGQVLMGAPNRVAKVQRSSMRFRGLSGRSRLKTFGRLRGKEEIALGVPPARRDRSRVSSSGCDEALEAVCMPLKIGVLVAAGAQSEQGQLRLVRRLLELPKPLHGCREV